MLGDATHSVLKRHVDLEALGHGDKMIVGTEVALARRDCRRI